MNDKNEMFESMPVGKLLLKLAIPSIVAQLVNLIYNMVDRIYLGHVEGMGASLLAGLGIFKAFSINLATDFVVPYTAIAISIVFVFAVVWLIMRFSIAKVQKQNIIETIRNDNI